MEVPYLRLERAYNRGSLSLANAIKIGVGELAVARNPLVLTTVVGSCIAVILYDYQNKVGGLAHVILPKPKLNRYGRYEENEAGKYASTAIPFLLQRMIQAGADKERIVAGIIGGASILPLLGNLNVGQRNIDATCEILSQKGIPIIIKDVGGNSGRVVFFDIKAGVVTVIYSRKEF
ncbi:MAG: chemotaxis protein CheD [Thermoprotei archaeon]|nr:MAG: chemotaxis protein CheD [Thermoprotei archaeon]